MAEIVNLKQARKLKAREDKARQAQENRIAHGRTKGEIQRDEAQHRKALSFVEGHRRKRNGDGDR